MSLARAYGSAPRPHIFSQVTQRLFNPGFTLPALYHIGIVVSVERHNTFCVANGTIVRDFDRQDG